MDYLTVVLEPRLWKVYRGVGVQDTSPIRREVTSTAFDMCAVQSPWLWICGRLEGSEDYFVERLSLLDLSSKSAAWSYGRIGAIAADPEGERVMVLALPNEQAEWPRLWLWDGDSWTVVATQVSPDISSKLAWIHDQQIVYESIHRTLAVLDILSGRIDSGSPGFFPVAAGDIHEWYAIRDKQVMRFPMVQPFAQPPLPLKEFRFGEVATLRVTRDGRVFSWTEPRFGLGSKGYIQEAGGPLSRFRAIDNGSALGAVLGPYSF